jgi:hypothetical protein
MAKLIPVPDDVSKPFWDAINEKRLVVQNCTSCNTLQYPPRPNCTQCGADTLEWKDTSGKGHILSFFVTYDGRYQRRIPDQPYNVAVVTLDDDPGINFYANLEGVPVKEVPIGAAVEVVFEEVAPGQLIHDWKLV